MDRFHANSFIEEGKIQTEKYNKEKMKESKIENINCLHLLEETSTKVDSNDATTSSIMAVLEKKDEYNFPKAEATKDVSNISPSCQQQPTSSIPKDSSSLLETSVCKKQKKEEVSQDHEIRRKYRNAREKERSCFLSQQIQELQRLLTLGGVTSDSSRESKSTILDRTANYIKLLQKDQYYSQIERQQQQLMSQLRGDMGQLHQQELRDVSINTSFLQSMEELQQHSLMTDIEACDKSNYYLDMMKIEVKDYRFIFESCSTGIAVSSLGGKIIDCNVRFCEVCNCTKEDLLGTTIFSLMDKSELQNAYNQLCTMISEAFWNKSTINHDIPHRGTIESQNPYCLLRGGIKVQNTALSIVLIKGEDGVPRLMCVTSMPGHLLP